MMRPPPPSPSGRSGGTGGTAGVWLVLSWLMVFATESGMAVIWAAVRVLPVVIAAMLWVVVVPSVAIVTLSLLSVAYMFWDYGMYPICPAVFCNCYDKIRRLYAAAMKVLRAGYVLGVMASQSLNSFIGKMLACINNRMEVLITCTSKYGSGAITAISWHCSIL